MSTENEETKEIFDVAAGKPVTFPKTQAERILKLQKECGFSDFTELPETDKQPETDGNNGQPSNSVNTKAGKRGGTQAGV